jgi:hypothetical protein
MNYASKVINSALKNEMENTIANIRILDVVRLVHGYFIFVFLIINKNRCGNVLRRTSCVSLSLKISV